jgi:hypothetical protein
MITKHQLDGFYLTFPYEKHLETKEQILQLISEQPTLTYGGGNQIANLDWGRKSDWSRPWVQLFKPDFDLAMNQAAQKYGYLKAIINELWFQQYKKGNGHGWHSHGNNFTGVYYLDFPPNTPITELINPWLTKLNNLSNVDEKELIIPDVKEGDVLIFPSYVVHRAPMIKNDINKSIISFNMDFEFGFDDYES